MTEQPSIQAQFAEKKEPVTTHKDTTPDLLSYKRFLDRHTETEQCKRARQDNIYALCYILVFVAGLLAFCYVLSYFFVG
jgi:hypothetical protein